MSTTTTAAKEHPILFSTPMVQAILEGRKTQTRRIVKFPLRHPEYELRIGEGETAPPVCFCKYSVGDILWVRETWGRIQPTHATPDGRPYDGWFTFKADYEDEKPGWEEGNYIFSGWKPSIHLPRKVCRLFLEVENIKVERLHDISEEDAISEGVEQNRDGSWHDYIEPNRLCQDAAKPSFHSLWMKINGEKSWQSNPWVWVISFKPILK